MMLSVVSINQSYSIEEVEQRILNMMRFLSTALLQ